MPPKNMSPVPVGTNMQFPQTPKGTPKRIFKRTPKRNPRCPATPYPAAFLEAVELLNDLDNFLGVGTVDISMPRRAAPGMDAPDNWLWLETPGPNHKFAKKSIEANLLELVDRGMVRCTYTMTTVNTARVRVYVLPDDVGRGLIQREDPNLRKWLKVVMTALDVSKEGWKGSKWRAGMVISDQRSKKDQDPESLFYIFNTLESPNPNPESLQIKDENTKELLRDVLNSKQILGVETKLYQYQNRTVALMLQKELAPEQTIDPRLRQTKAPTGEVYYFDIEATEIFEEPRYYEDVRGGILAEEMGTGKTLICLAVILASKYQMSYIPDEYLPALPLRPSIASLGEMCVASIWRNAIPWTQFVESMPENCVKKIQDSRGFYEIPPALKSRSSRYTYDSTAMERIYLGTGTIVVCPLNLVDQWLGEIKKHLKKDALKVLTLATLGAEIPSVDELLRYDLIIISRPCFDAEAREGRDSHGRTEFYGAPPRCQCTYKGSSRVPDCVCFRKEAIYKSPLMSIHWKRLIVDEGQNMTSSNNGTKNKGISVAEKLPAERRWIVTGTPTSELVGIMPGVEFGETDEELKVRTEQELEERKERQIHEALHLERIKGFVCDFLKQKPWAPMEDRRNKERASWKQYIVKSFTDRREGSTMCVRNLFQRLFIRHRLEDVEKEIPLPRLERALVRLYPGFFEKIFMNLLIGALASNAVTSERVGVNYMFDPRNRGSLKILTNNLLKVSGFYTTGYSIKEVEDMVRTSKKHLEEDGARWVYEDINLLQKAIEAGEMALSTKEWRQISASHDMVYFISDFPEQLAPIWSLFASNPPTTNFNKLHQMGGTQVQNLQKAVNANASENDIISKLETLGNAFTAPGSQQQDVAKSWELADKRNPHTKAKGSSEKNPPKTPSTKLKTPLKIPLKSVLKKSKPVEIIHPDSPLAKARIVGTASTKLTYLLNKIVALHKTEKILIFYEDDRIAWYISQALEILGIENLGYAGGLPAATRSYYLLTFQTSEKYRVLLMSLNQAARGLNISCASRVFFVNPVWQRDIEQQALKRAHRIGQTKTVYVETLILRDTIEEAMWNRREEMTKKERTDAKDSLVDPKMRDIISNAEFLKVEPNELEGDQVIRLAFPEPIFGDGKHGGIYDKIEIHSTTNSRAEESPEELVVSDLPNAQVRWLNATTSKRNLSQAPPAASPEPVASSSRPVKRKKHVGFKANDRKDWMEDSDDDFVEPSNSKKKKGTP